MDMTAVVVVAMCGVTVRVAVNVTVCGVIVLGWTLVCVIVYLFTVLWRMVIIRRRIIVVVMHRRTRV